MWLSAIAWADSWASGVGFAPTCFVFADGSLLVIAFGISVSPTTVPDDLSDSLEALLLDEESEVSWAGDFCDGASSSSDSDDDDELEAAALTLFAGLLSAEESDSDSDSELDDAEELDSAFFFRLRFFPVAMADIFVIFTVVEVDLVGERTSSSSSSASLSEEEDEEEEEETLAPFAILALLILVAFLILTSSESHDSLVLLSSELLSASLLELDDFPCAT